VTVILQVFPSSNCDILIISFVTLFMCNVQWLITWWYHLIGELCNAAYTFSSIKLSSLNLGQDTDHPDWFSSSSSSSSSSFFCSFPQSLMGKCFKLVHDHFCAAFQFIICCHPVIQCYVVLTAIVLCMKWTSNGHVLSPKLFSTFWGNLVLAANSKLAGKFRPFPNWSFTRLALRETLNQIVSQHTTNLCT
jgi:hypothetical protein